MLLEWENVSGKKSDFRLQNISFKLPAGYIMGLAGENGAGKTTLIDYMMNPKKRYYGTIKLDGVDIHDNHRKVLNDIGFVSENNMFFSDLSIMANAQMIGVFYEKWDKELFERALREMNISVGKVVGSLSRGEFMKFQMAFALAHHPKLYLLDEVTAGMDPVFRIEFFKLLQDVIAREDASVLMTSHIKTEMERKMDYLGVLEKGKLIRFGEVEC